MAQWTIELKRDADYWEDRVTVVDEDGSPVVFSDAEITIHPNKVGQVQHDDVVWSVDNGKLVIVSAGVFGFEVPITEIDGYEWSSGKFCWSVTYTDGHVDGSWMTGKVAIEDACL
jgi:hypothetical protein